MMRILSLVVLVLLCAAVWAQGEPVPQTQTANVAVTEARVDRPFPIDWAKVNMLAGRIFAQPWLRGCKGEWNEFYPSPSRITTTYGQPAKGDSLTPVDDRESRQRPCWVFWKDGRSGVAVEKCVRGNWIVSTFVVDQTIQVPIPGPVVYVDRPVDRIVNVPQPYPVNVPMMIPARQYIPPAMVGTIWTPAMPINAGSKVVGPWRDIVTLGLAWLPQPSQPQPCPPIPPRPPKPPPPPPPHDVPCPPVPPHPIVPPPVPPPPPGY